MDAIQALREMVEACGLTHRQIARRMGRYDAYVSQALTRSTSPGADTIASIARACGYRLELVPMQGGDHIVIGDDMDDATTSRPHDDIAQARALLSRAVSLLDGASRGDDSTSLVDGR